MGRFPRVARGALTIMLAGLGMSSAFALTPASAAAQGADPDRALVTGRRSIALSLPEGGGPAFEIWRMRSETQNRGLIAIFDVDVTETERDSVSQSQRSILLVAGPAFRRYIGATHPVAPYLQTTVLAGGRYDWADVQYEGAPSPPNPWSLMGAIRFGVGAEWFPYRSVSLNGHTGLGLGATYHDAQRVERWNVGLSTFTSALALQIYF